MRSLKSNDAGRYQTPSGACAQLNVSRNTLIKIATECNAIVRFGRSVRIDMEALYNGIDEKYKIE